ncbi:MAG: GFA family protein [bacterium]|nr:GFA family protein [bacterium]
MKGGRLEGSCLCGQIGYASDGPIGPLGNCHCPTCRKAHGAAFSTTARVPREGFRWIRGEDLLASYESSPGKRRFFCPRCGSQLVATRDDASEIILRLGSLDTDPGSKPVVHIWTELKAPWYEIDAKLPTLLKGVPDAEESESSAQ